MQRVWLAGLALGGLCEATPWEDGLLDDPGLMQVKKNMLSHVVAPDLASPSVHQGGDASLHSLDAMENFVSSLATSVPSQAEIDLVKNLIVTMTNQFVPALETASAEDVLEHNAKLEAHALCKTHKEQRMGVGGDVTILQAACDTTRAKHEGCRKAYKSFIVFMEDVNAVHLAGGTAGANGWQTLAPASSYTRISELGSLCTTRGTFFTHVGQYKGKAPVDTVSVSCDTDQTSFEQTWCDWLSARTSTCLAYAACVSTLDAAGSISYVLERDENRRNTLKSIRILKCRLQHIADTWTSGEASDFATTDTCGQAWDATALTGTQTPDAPVATYPQGGHYNLALALPDPDEPCGENPDGENPPMPCVAATAPASGCDCTAWRNKEYNADSSHVEGQTSNYWDLGQHQNPTQCFGECVIPTTVEPIDTTGCVDTDDAEGKCSIYTYHQDACGAYEIDDAFHKCCACGGGEFPPFQIVHASQMCKNSVELFPLEDKVSIQMCYEACLAREGPTDPSCTLASGNCVAQTACTHFTFGTTQSDWARGTYRCQGCSAAGDSDIEDVSSTETVNYNIYAMPPKVAQQKCPFSSTDENEDIIPHPDRVFRSEEVSVEACYRRCLAETGCIHFSYAFAGGDYSKSCMGCSTTANLKVMEGSTYGSFNLPGNDATIPEQP